MLCAEVLESDGPALGISIVTLSKLLDHFELEICIVGLLIACLMGAGGGHED